MVRAGLRDEPGTGHLPRHGAEIYLHNLKLEDARAMAAYGQHSEVGKILEIRQELPGRIHIVLIRRVVGF